MWTASAFVMLPKPSATPTTTRAPVHKETVEETLANLCLEEDLECDLAEYETMLHDLEDRRELHMQQARTIRKVLAQLDDEKKPKQTTKKCFDSSAWKDLSP